MERLSENSRLPSRRPYELLKWGIEGPFLQCCATKTHAPQSTERLFRQFQKVFSEVRRGSSDLLGNSFLASVRNCNKTVGNHISNIFAKLQVADRVQAIIRAREAGLGRAHRWRLTAEPPEKRLRRLPYESYLAERT